MPARSFRSPAIDARKEVLGAKVDPRLLRAGKEHPLNLRGDEAAGAAPVDGIHPAPHSCRMTAGDVGDGRNSAAEVDDRASWLHDQIHCEKGNKPQDKSCDLRECNIVRFPQH